MLQAEEAVLRGEVVAFPTETVYGLGVQSDVGRLFALKGRDGGKPCALHVASLEGLEVSGAVRRLAEAFWPGPLTVVTEEGLGIRMVAHPVARELIERVGPLWGTSANLSGEASCLTADEVRAVFPELVVLEGECTYGAASTVVSLQGTPRVLRAGVIPASEVLSLL